MGYGGWSDECSGYGMDQARMGYRGWSDECSGYGMDQAWITEDGLMNAVGTEWIKPGLQRMV